MLKSGILNPAINSLLSRVRHTNTLVIADRGFPFWPDIEIIDISLVADLPKVIDVVTAIRENFHFGFAFMAEEFKTANNAKVQRAFRGALRSVPTSYEPHLEFKKRTWNAVGLIRTGDTTPYANVILESA